jgi:hypothetical protein
MAGFSKAHERKMTLPRLALDRKGIINFPTSQKLKKRALIVSSEYGDFQILIL